MRASLIAAVLLASLAASASAGSRVVLTTYNLIQIEPGEGHYHLWAIADGNAVSLSPFNIADGGVGFIDLQGRPITDFSTSADLTAASEVWISVEADGAA